MNNQSTTYFADGKRTIDFVLAYKKSWLTDLEKLAKFETFIENLKIGGFLLETDSFVTNQDLVFIKIHAPNDIIILYANLCDVNLASRSVAYRPPFKSPPHFMATPLTNPSERDEIYSRAREYNSERDLKTITSAEKGLVIYKILLRMKFGHSMKEFGLNRLCKEGILSDYFVLHDGHHEWTESGMLNDRQLLAKYWGNFKCLHKAQPMFLIEKYYGPEYAFYFAWLEHYLKMLFVPAILSILIFSYGLITINSSLNLRSKEICDSDQILCPRCHYLKCKFESMKSACMTAYLTHVFDNPLAIMFAVFISIWSTVFMEYWQRNEAVLQLKWNVKEIEYDTLTRSEYIDKAKKMKYSNLTLSDQPIVPFVDQCLSYIVTTVSIVLLLSLVIAAVVGVMIYRIAVDIVLLKQSEDEIIVNNRRMIASISGACMSAIFIVLFKKLFASFSMWLTEIENHRTQYDFDNAYIFKAFGLAFVNNYAAVIYIAFFKGKFFTHPGDMSNWNEFGALGSDICDVNGCIIDLSIQLIIIMFFKAFVSHGLQNLEPIIMKKVSQFLSRVDHTTNLTFYEEEYLKPKMGQYFLLDEYEDMVIQYGFVVLFVAGFPLAPFLAFLNNVFEMRTDASKITKSFRRPISMKVSGLGAWFGILQAMTYLGVVFNAFVIAFTSMFVEIEVYRYWKKDIGFHNFTISSFDIDDFKFTKKNMLSAKLCFYPGMRHPPDHPNKYQLTPEYWFILTLRFLVVVIFEHLVIFIKGILAYYIPDVPDDVLEQLNKRKRNQPA